MKKNKKGFTLIETGLVLGIAGFIGFIAFTQLLKNTELNKAEMAGQQIKLIGDATNAYISNHYDLLSSLSNSQNTTSDLGPRTCSTSNNNCVITTDTLISEGLLPSSFSGKNVYGLGYNIILKRSGSSPYYKIYGLITTNNTLSIGNNIRYDLLGKAMQAAGIDSGMTRNSSSQVSGFNGSWSANSVDYSNINKLGQLAYQTGYGTYNYSVFLRRDGTLPMTGNLNMGSQDINNAINITASGTTSSGILKSINNTEVGKDLSVEGNGNFNGSVGVKGLKNTDIPSGMAGGIISPEYYAQSGFYVSKNGNNINAKNWAIQATKDGNLIASNNINAGNWLIAHNGGGNTMWIGGDGAPASDGTLGNDYEIRMDTIKPLTIWNTSMSDRTVKLLDVWGSQNINGNLSVSTSSGAEGKIVASGNIETNQFLKINSTIVAGTSCNSIGLIGRDGTGQILSCKSGIWTPEQPVGIPQPWPSTTPPSGWLICNGQSFNTSTYPLLAKAYPSGKLPDLRGSFIRGLDQGRGIDSGRGILTDQRASVVTGTDDNWSDNDVGVLHGPSSVYSRDSINIYDYSNGSNGQDPKYWVHFGGGTGPSNGNSQGLSAGDIKLNNNGSNGFYGGARPYNTSFVYIVRAL